jgi:hypothetical protein
LVATHIEASFSAAGMAKSRQIPTAAATMGRRNSVMALQIPKIWRSGPLPWERK